MILKAKSWSMMVCWNNHSHRSSHWRGGWASWSRRMWVSWHWKSIRASSNVDREYDRSYFVGNYKSLNWSTNR